MPRDLRREPGWIWFGQLRGLNTTTAFGFAALVRIAVVLAALLGVTEFNSPGFRSLMNGGLQPSPRRPVVVACSCFAYGMTNIEFGSPTAGFVTGVVLSGMFLVRKSIWPAVIAIVSWNLFLSLGGMV